jgi:hypothetical protein
MTAFSLFLHRAQDRLEALFEVAAVARAGQQRPHIDGKDRRSTQGRRRLARLDTRRHALDDGGLAHARIADEQGVVLAPPSQHVQRPLDLLVTTDQRIDLALAGTLVQVDGVDRQRIFGRPSSPCSSGMPARNHRRRGRARQAASRSRAKRR